MRVTRQQSLRQEADVISKTHTPNPPTEPSAEQIRPSDRRGQRSKRAKAAHIASAALRRPKE